MNAKETNTEFIQEEQRTSISRRTILKAAWIAPVLVVLPPLTRSNDAYASALQNSPPVTEPLPTGGVTDQGGTGLPAGPTSGEPGDNGGISLGPNNAANVKRRKKNIILSLRSFFGRLLGL